MQRNSFLRRPLLVFSSLVLLNLTSSAVTNASDGKLSVQVKTSKIRTEPKSWAKGSATVNYGDQLTQLSKEGDWLKVKTNSGVEGFIHNSAITTRRVVLKSGKNAVPNQAESEDIVLAGKGFSKAVEDQYAATNSQLNFKAVDQMERYKVGEGELQSFYKNGHLGGKV